MDEITTYIPTLFEIRIKELGWIYDVYLDVDGKSIPATWVRSEHLSDGNYSLFEVIYTFDVPKDNQKAIFHFSIGNQKIDCEPLCFDVKPFGYY